MAKKKVDNNTKHAIDDAVDQIEEKEDTGQADQIDESEDLDKDPGPRLVSDKPRRRVKALIALVILLLLVGVIAAVPFLRYTVVGLFVNKPVAVHVVDSATNKPVTGAKVSLGRVDATTDKSGNANFSHVAVGEHYVTITKNHYNDSEGTLLVPIFARPDATRKLTANGRMITVSVTNSITGKALDGADVVLGDSTAATDKTGQAHVVVSTNAGKLEGTATHNDYNQATFIVDTATNDDQTVKVAVAPKGSLYYLSKATGVINLMKSNLDGSSASVVVQATGKEFDRDTMIMASRDWNYIALQANREGSTQLYLVNTSDGSLTKIDSEVGNYQMAGWIEHSLVFTLGRERQSWQPGMMALKIYDAERRALTSVEDTQASGSGYYDYQAQFLTAPTIADGAVHYGRYWTASYSGALADKKAAIVTADNRGIKRTVHEFDASKVTIANVVANSPTTSLVGTYDVQSGATTVYTLADGKLSPSQIDANTFNNTTYPAYLKSLSGNAIAWHESRDGKFYVFVADASGNNKRQLELVDYKVYGWYGNDYLLLTRHNSELYIYPVAGGVVQPVKISDYHRPTVEFMGYGYGGGF